MPDFIATGDSASHGIPRSWGIVSLLCLLLTAVVPPLYFTLVADVPTPILLFGAGTWAVAIAAKYPLAVFLNRWLGKSNRPIFLAGLQGLLSALLELIAAGAYLFHLPPQAGLDDVLAFGTAAGSAEVVYVLAAGIRAGSDPQKAAEWARGAVKSICVRYQTPLERFFALVGHTGARGMVYVGLRLPGVMGLGFLVAVLATFSAIDGVAYYGHLRHWNWLNASVCRRAHAFFSSASVLELSLFVVGFRMLT